MSKTERDNEGVQTISHGSGGDHRLDSTFEDEEEYEGDNHFSVPGRGSGNDKPFVAPVTHTSTTDKKIDSEEDGEILDDEDEEEFTKTEVVEEAANTWLKKGDETKPKENLGGYKLRPELDAKFRPGDVQIWIEKIVRDHLDGHPYDAEEAPKLVKVLAEEIQTKIKSLNYKRYKLVTYVVIGERKGEGVSAATRCIWDHECDCLATFTFLNETTFCCCTVYGIYVY